MTRIAAIIPDQKEAPVAGPTVQDTYLAFGAARYRESAYLAASALKWVRLNDAANEEPPLVAIYAWSLFRSVGRKYEQAEADALGLLIRNRRRIVDRAKGVTDLDLLTWCASHIEGETSTPEHVQSGSTIAALLIRLAKAPTSGGERRRLAKLLQIAGASDLADLLWQSVRGLKDDAASARASLLVILYELGEDEALEHLFRFAGAHGKYLSAFTALSARARSDPSAKLYSAVRQNFRTIDALKDRAFRDFASTIVGRLPNMSARVNLDVSDVLERQKTRGQYSLVVQVEPDESDPPLSLKLELLQNDDFATAKDESSIKEVVNETLLFERSEVEFIVAPKDVTSASNIAIRVSGETASGQTIDEVRRFRVSLAEADGSFETIAIENLLDVYSGYDGRPVTGAAFVGREEEIAVLERCVTLPNPGAIVLYGVRRLGKTSLLDELRRRHCLTTQKHSQTLFLVIPVDEFSVMDVSGRTFLDRFLKHVWNSVLNDTKNELVRRFFVELGITFRELEAVGQLDPRFAETSFLTRLREYLKGLRDLASGRITSTILVFDEFDKLLEHYRSGHEADVEELTNQLRRAATEEPHLGLILVALSC